MTAPQTPDREQEIRARAEAATRCPEAVVNGRLDGEHTWVGGSFTSVRCELCGFSRTRGERAEDTMELLAEIDRLRAGREAAVAAAVRRALEGIADDWAAHCPDHSTSDAVSMRCRCDDANELRMRAEGVREDAVAPPPREQGEEARDALPAWLYQRFGKYPIGVDWDEPPETDQEYWAHEASAVRRAVARGGFKTPEGGAA